MLRTIARSFLVGLALPVFGAIALVAIAMGGVSPELTKQVDQYVPLGLPEAFSPPPPPAEPGPGGRLVIPSIGVNAGLVTIGMDESGHMGAPAGAWEVGWFDFTAPAGQPGNTVMTGHVDYHDVGPAVFWRLRELGPGDRAEVHRQDGSVILYQVTQVESYPANSAPVEAIIGPTLEDALTLITCDGGFNPAAGEYDRRLVVRALRIEE